MMSTMTTAEIDALADTQFKSLEIYKVPTTPFDVTQKAYVDNKFATAVTSSTAAVTALIDGAPDSLNTLREIASSLNDNANLATVLTNQISSVSASVTTEATARAAADAAHLGFINRNYNLIVEEQQARADTTAALQASIGQVFTTLQGEAVTRQEGDVGLLNTINTDRAARASEDTALHLRVDAEVSSRQQADTVLSQRITDEEKYRQEAVETLINTKFDVSDRYSGGPEQDFKISDGAYLYVGSNWRIAASTSGQAKRLCFEYNPLTPGSTWSVSVPFIRPAQ